MTWIVAVLGALVLSSAAIGTASKTYEGHALVRIYPNSGNDIDHMVKVGKRFPRDIDFVDEELPRSRPGLMLDVLTSPRLRRKFLESLAQRGVMFDVLTRNFQNVIDDHKTLNDRARLAQTHFFHSYHPLDEIARFLDEAVTRCHGMCEVLEVGRSYEGRPLRAIRISGSLSQEKRAIWIDAGIHAREWISISVALYIVDKLVEDYPVDPEITQILDNYDVYILPCVNPDGYNYTWETDRLWRKTRSPNNGSFCIGTDPNRNFDFMWGVVGASTDPCANNFRGPHPNSELETVAVADFILSRKGMWAFYITLHSKGQLIMSPWGYTAEKPADFPELQRVGEAMQQAMIQTHGKVYIFGTAHDVLYGSSGTSRDWARGVAGVPYVYTLELRDIGQYGWSLPPDQILPTSEEVMAGLTAAIAETI